MSSTILQPFQLLELNVISAQDLSPVSRSMRAYAVAWIHPNRKLSTRVDANGRNNPTWNDKFVFRVDEEFLRSDTSAVMIDIYALHWFRDIHVGRVRVLVGNLLPPPQTKNQQSNNKSLEMRFVALQVRRPSGRPQGILNIGVGLLDSSMRSMPLYTQDSSAVGYRHLMGEDDPFAKNSSTVASNTVLGKYDLRRSKSDSSSLIGSEIAGIPMIDRVSSSRKASSMVNGSELSEKKKNKKQSSNGSSIISGSDIFKKQYNKVTKPALNGPDVITYQTGKESGGNLLVNGFENRKEGSTISGSDGSYRPRKVDSPKDNKLKSHKRLQPVITQSELGPSPSEVAAAKVKEKLMKQTYDEESSIVMSWDMESSIEGLQSKLERWRAELPPLYDTSLPSSSSGGGGSTTRHSRRHTEGGGGPGLFSCFSNVGGCEMSIVCGSGGPNNKEGKKRLGSSGGHIRSQTTNESSYF